MKTPRNSICTCGSGRKFKKCCGDAATMQRVAEENARKAREAWLAKREEEKKLEAVKPSSDPSSFVYRKSPMATMALLAAVAGMSLGPNRR